jgi:hypothetical protein
LLDLFSRLDDTFLAHQLRLLAELGLDLPHDTSFILITEHLIALSAILYLAVSFAELAYFPRAIRRYDLVCPAAGLYPLVSLLNTNLRLLGYSKAMLDCLEDFNWSDFADLASSEPQCMRYFLDDILSFLQTNQWLVSGYELRNTVLRNLDDASSQDESYWPSWRGAPDDYGSYGVGLYEEEESELFLHDSEEGSPY